MNPPGTDGQLPDAGSAGGVPPMEGALATAYPDGALDPIALDRLLAQAAGETEGAVREAHLFAAARRAPRSMLERLSMVVRPADREAVLRGFAGRPRSELTGTLPRFASADPPTASEAAVVGRFGLAVSPAVDPTAWLASADLNLQIAGARWLAAPGTPIPEPQVLLTLEPAAIPSLARSLSQRFDVAPLVWTAMLETLAARAHVATRRWAHAWRAVRDAVPVATHPELLEPLRLAIAIAAPTNVPPAAMATLTCENAAAIDRVVGGMPLETLRCAPTELASIARAARATVLGSAVTLPEERSHALLVLIAEAQGNTAVLAAVALGVAVLPPRAARPVLARLVLERDPGVMAAVLETLVGHPTLAAAVPHASLADLLAAPFAIPGGAALEAQLNSVRLARALHLADVDSLIAASSLRAVHAAGDTDASALQRLASHPSGSTAPSTRIAFDTDAGTFEVEIRADAAPAAAATFLDTVRHHRYDGLTLHREVPGFVVQGGDPRGDGYGGVDDPTPTELSLRPFVRGSLGVPLAGLDTGGIQFFIVLADTPQLDGRYPWIGEVTRGMDVVDGLLVGDVIQHVRVVDR